jgi:hypothetical protein
VETACGKYFFGAVDLGEIKLAAAADGLQPGEMTLPCNAVVERGLLP